MSKSREWAERAETMFLEPATNAVTGLGGVPWTPEALANVYAAAQVAATLALYWQREEERGADLMCQCTTCSEHRMTKP